MRRHQRVVGIQDRDAAVRRRRAAPRRAPPSLSRSPPESRTPRDGRCRCSARPRSGAARSGECANVTDAASARLENEEAGRGVGRSTVYGCPSSLLKEPGGAIVGPIRSSKRSDEILRRRLAGRPGDADDGDAGAPPDDLGGKSGHGRQSVGHEHVLGTSTGRVTIAAIAPASIAAAAWSCPSACSPARRETGRPE